MPNQIYYCHRKFPSFKGFIMPANLANQVAVVTGASKGIGKAIADQLCGQGMTVILLARTENELDKATKSMSDLPGSAVAIVCDITLEDEVLSVFTQIDQRFGRIDLLVNNAGMGFGDLVKDMSLATWKAIVDVNLTGAFLCCREAFKRMEQGAGGRIINIGSIASMAPRPGASAYTASKAALDGLTTALALEGRDSNIAACIIHPGNTYTDIWAGKEELLKVEPVMAPAHVAKQVLNIALLPLDVNVLSTVMLPTTQKLVGRG
ncbi:MAG: NAD(P)-dependent dehydrogenase (short-subunit alcohol dehydrogenase family) [Pseudomonadales bacterium]|jgi:NAD(P)-dependent dehydrogenase (short-subunit alcohol dehydrogenase family)